ncbi:hypothetical protein HZS_3288 [Henneguya salminicola]|nr:hypothetical protein HZS_3288 [Henneguya salminicola]
MGDKNNFLNDDTIDIDGMDNNDWDKLEYEATEYFATQEKQKLVEDKENISESFYSFKEKRSKLTKATNTRDEPPPKIQKIFQAQITMEKSISYERQIEKIASNDYMNFYTLLHAINNIITAKHCFLDDLSRESMLETVKQLSERLIDQINLKIHINIDEILIKFTENLLKYCCSFVNKFVIIS